MNRLTSKDGTTIAFETRGQGPAIILVGGALSDRSAAAPLAVAPGAAFYRVRLRSSGARG